VRPLSRAAGRGWVVVGTISDPRITQVGKRMKINPAGRIDDAEAHSRQNTLQTTVVIIEAC
jgi:hypothetical protein